MSTPARRRARHAAAGEGGGRRGQRHTRGIELAIGDRERDRDRMAVGLGRELGDSNEEALLDPLEHEAVVREQPVAAGGAFERERPDPGVELLGRQFLAEGVEAALPEKGTAGHACSIRGECGGPTRCDRRCRDCRTAVGSYPQGFRFAGVSAVRTPMTRARYPGRCRRRAHAVMRRADDPAAGINAAAIDSDSDNAL